MHNAENSFHPSDDEDELDSSGSSESTDDEVEAAEREPIDEVPFEGLGPVLHNGEPIRSHAEAMAYFGACFVEDMAKSRSAAVTDWPESLGHLDADEVINTTIEVLPRQAAEHWTNPDKDPALRTDPRLWFWGIEMARRSIRRKRIKDGRWFGSEMPDSDHVDGGEDPVFVEQILQRIFWLSAPGVRQVVPMLTPLRADALLAKLRAEEPMPTDDKAANAWRQQLARARGVLAPIIETSLEAIGLSVPDLDNGELLDHLLQHMIEDGWLTWDDFAPSTHRRFSQTELDRICDEIRRRGQRWR